MRPSFRLSDPAEKAELLEFLKGADDAYETETEIIVVRGDKQIKFGAGSTYDWCWAYVDKPEPAWPHG